VDKLIVLHSTCDEILGGDLSAFSFFGDIRRVVFEFADGRIEVNGKKIE
jgi:hypothetical protein